MTKIDILLPYWGEFSLLKQTVDSVLAQTSDAWTLTILDDCYPSLEAKKYYDQLGDKRIAYVRHSKNIGITNNFNFAVDRASAEYCMILGCDDVLLPNYVETALMHIGDADLYQPKVEIIDAEGKTYLPLADRVKRLMQPRKSGGLGGEKLAVSLCHGNWLYFPSIAWRTSTLKKYRFDPKYKIVEDVVVELNIIKDGGVLYFDTETTFQYRRFAGSLSSKEKSKGGVRFHEEGTVYTKFAHDFKQMGWYRASRAAALHMTSRVHRIIS